MIIQKEKINNLVKKIFKEKLEFDKEDIGYSCDLYDIKWEFIDTIYHRENAWDYFLNYLKMANSIIEDNLKVSKDYMMKKTYYEIDYDDWDDDWHFIIMRCEDGLFPDPSFHCEMEWKSVSNYIFHVRFWRWESLYEYCITYKDLIKNIKNIIEKNWENYNKALKKQWKELRKLHTKEWYNIEDFDYEEKSDLKKKLYNPKKFDKVLKKSEELCKIDAKNFKA